MALSPEKAHTQGQVCSEAVGPCSRLGAHSTKVRNDRANIQVSRGPDHTPSWRLGHGRVRFWLPRGHRPTFLCLSPIFTAGHPGASLKVTSPSDSDLAWEGFFYGPTQITLLHASPPGATRLQVRSPELF